MNERLVAAT